MAWLGKAYEILPVLKQLKPFIDVEKADARSREATCAGSPQNTRSAKLHDLVEDVHYFIRDYAYIADQAPLQIYASALVFAPECSHAKSLFRNCMPEWVAIPPQVAKVWDNDTLVLATISYDDRTLRVWETATGVCILKLPRLESDRPIGVCFSHDSKYLAAAYTAHNHTKCYSVTSFVVYETRTGTAVNCIRAEFPDWPEIRLAFPPDANDTLLVAVRYEGMLEMWLADLKSHVFEQKWHVPTQTHDDQDFVFSANTSLISSFAPDIKSIVSWDVWTGVHASTQSIEGHASYFMHFVESRVGDLMYATMGEECDQTNDKTFPGMIAGLYRLDAWTGQVDLFARMEPTPGPKAISLRTGRIAYTRDDTGLIKIRLKSKDSARRSPFFDRVTVTHDERMIFLQYEDCVVLQDVTGHVLFQSPKVIFRPHENTEHALISDDGSVILAQLDRGTHLWFVESGRELQLPLPHMRHWLCSPAVSRDRKLMACCWYAVPGSDLEHAGYGIDYTGQRKQRFLRWIRYLLWDLESDTKFLAVDRHCNPAMDLQWMQFSEDLETLHTSQGNLNCRNGGWDTNKLYDYTPESSPAVSLDPIRR
jgi:WD40 repeat protein